jgi:hypothetical protein
MLLKKLKTKTHEKMHKNENSQNSHSFLAIALALGAFDSVGIKPISIILRLIPIRFETLKLPTAKPLLVCYD